MKRVLFLAVFLAGALVLQAQEVPAPGRPQEPVAPFPYRVEEVVFENPEAGVRLAGTLTMPAKGRKFPAVVLLTGSGQQNRDEELFGHKPFLVLADHLTRRGIAVLRFDDRGVGGSEAGPGPAAATSVDFAGDALAALDYLGTRREIDHAKTGLAGHSEGAIVAFMTAAAHPDRVAFVVSMAGPGVTGADISAMQSEDLMLVRGIPAGAAKIYADKQRRDLALIFGNTPEFVEANTDSLAALMVPGFKMLPTETQNMVRGQIAASNSAWTRFFVAHDPAVDLEKVKSPVLALNGDKDIQVRSPFNPAAIRAALERGGNTLVETIEYPGLNHLFQTAGTGDVAEYEKIEETMSPPVMEDIADWILKIAK